MTDGPAPRPRTFRLTVRARLALTYAGLIMIAGLVLLAILTYFLVIAPTYEFPGTGTDGVSQVPSVDVDDGRSDTGGGGTPDDGVTYQDSVEPLVVSSRDDVMRLFLWASAGALVVLAAGGAWAGWLVAGRMLRPLQEVNRAAHRAARGHLDHRIALQGPRDEIRELADTFDEMLAELERSVGAHRRFAANASHELRTPLATNRAMLDVAITSPEPPDRAVLERLRETNERSIATVEALLDLAEAESAEAAEPRRVELGALVASVVEETRAEAAGATVRLGAEIAPVAVDGDEVLLRQLVGNLVQNAVRHNLPDGSVTVSTSTDGPAVVLEVSNTGPELDAATVGTLTAPFARGGGRTRAAADRGRGLGLSIVAAIAARHDAELDLAPRDGGGLRALVRFPR
ncbi:HAMP domain-containing sensor histidine kinase [Isoptericola hypogeus]|uniref:histidine kinase n=1 Tax=Isoptericola hypogeus TaxID=300179 RepID=A0ABP4VHD4_9MICO